jgi:hypothetical protein
MFKRKHNSKLPGVVTLESLQPWALLAIIGKCYHVTKKNTLPIEKRLADKIINIKENVKHLPRVGKHKNYGNMVTKAVKPTATEVYMVTIHGNSYRIT